MQVGKVSDESLANPKASIHWEAALRLLYKPEKPWIDQGNMFLEEEEMRL